jgi:hypothetical protein
VAPEPSDIDTGVPGKTIKTKTPKKVYRGDTRNPDQVNASKGFKAVPGKNSLKDYVWHKRPANVVSTSTRESSAGAFTINKPAGIWNGWVYEIRTPQEGIDVNATLGSYSRFKPEREIAYVGGIDSKYIVRARKWEGGMPVGGWIDNPEYEGER